MCLGLSSRGAFTFTMAHMVDVSWRRLQAMENLHKSRLWARTIAHGEKLRVEQEAWVSFHLWETHAGAVSSWRMNSVEWIHVGAELKGLQSEGISHGTRWGRTVSCGRYSILEQWKKVRKEKKRQRVVDWTQPSVFISPHHSAGEGKIELMGMVILVCL